MKKFNVYEHRILSTLSFSGRPLSTRQVAGSIGVHWQTVKKHLMTLYRKNKVYGSRFGNKTYWSTEKNDLISYIKRKREMRKT